MTKPTEPPNNDALAANLRAELDQLGPQKAVLSTQLNRVNKRMRYLSNLLGIKMPTYKDAARGNKIEAVKRLLREAKGPMSVDSIMRELESLAGAKKLDQRHVTRFMMAHPREFVNVGENVWDIAPRWETKK